MFKYLPLFVANLHRKLLRTALTLASIAVAFLLFGLLQTMQSALTGGASLAGADRLITMHKVSLIQFLPYNYINRIRSAEGVRSATFFNWFGGIYQEDRNQVAVMAADPESFFDVYHEYALPPEQLQAWLADQTGAIVGTTLAERFDWQVGDTVPMRSNFHSKTDGSNVWELTISGIYDAANGDNSSLYFHYDYLNEATTLPRDEIGWVALRIEDPDRAPEVAAAIDAGFANSFAETKTSTESAFIQGFANQMGNIAKIVTAIAGAVFFTMLLVSANTMAQSVRERINEIAVLKTLGYSNFKVTLLILAESLTVTAAGGIAGLALAAVLAGWLGELLQQYFPIAGVPAGAYVTGALLIVALGILAAALPAAQAWRLRITDALRHA